MKPLAFTCLDFKSKNVKKKKNRKGTTKNVNETGNNTPVYRGKKKKREGRKERRKKKDRDKNKKRIKQGEK